jgi:hypothetical protein
LRPNYKWYLRTNKKQTRKKKKERKMRDLSEKDFIGEGVVDVGGIKEGDAGVEGMVDESDHVFFGLGKAIDAGHAHATEALCRHLQSLRTQLYPPHDSSGLHFFSTTMAAACCDYYVHCSVETQVERS